MSIRNLESLFSPRSVAVIGASDRPGSVGAVVMRNILGGGFTGAVWPVNPGHPTVAGHPAWPAIGSLPEAPGLAVICTRAATVPALIAELGDKGTRAAIVLSAGLRDTAPGGGTFEEAMLRAAKPHLLRILGPNCVGAVMPHIGLNASFAPAGALAGHLAFVSQSGALATAMLDWANGRGLGFSHFISLGDCADVDAGDVLDYLATDTRTRAILMYAESVKSGRKFMTAARAASRNKPVIMVKAGRMPEGARAAASHTGALAGSDGVFEAAALRAGILRVDTLEDLFEAAEVLARGRPVRGERLAIVTNGGGAAVLAADSLALGGGGLAALEPSTHRLLDQCLPATWSGANPVDIIGDASPARHAAALETLLTAPEVDAVLLMHAPTALASPDDVAAACLPAIKASRKPVLACWLGGPLVAGARARFETGGVPCFDTPERGVQAWLRMVRHERIQRQRARIPASRHPAGPLGAGAQAPLRAAMEAGREWLEPEEVQALLREAGIPVLASGQGATAAEAATCAAGLGFPVALKVVSPQIIHKSDVGGVVLGLPDAAAVEAAAREMQARIARLRPDADIQGYRVQEMARRPDAREFIAGISSDPVFGPVVLFGLGGTDVEVARNFAMALPPLDTELALDLIARSGVGRYLAAHRGKPAVDTAALADALVRVAGMACALPALAELDINPLVADNLGVLALDARVRLHPAGHAPPVPAIVPYPASLEQVVQVAGTDLLLRPIRPEDGWALRRFYEQASAGDLRLRFFMSRREVPLSEIARFSQIDYDREMAIVAVAPGTAGEIAGEARAMCDPDNLRAEFAVQVASGWQRKGLGRILMARLIEWLKARGTAELRGECLVGNEAMAALARACGMESSVVEPDGTVVLRLPLGSQDSGEAPAGPAPGPQEA